MSQETWLICIKLAHGARCASVLNAYVIKGGLRHDRAEILQVWLIM